MKSGRAALLMLLALGTFAVPFAAETQPAGKVYRVGVLWTTHVPVIEDLLGQGLRELGWIEGQNFVFERRYSQGQTNRYPALAAELVRLQPDLILTSGTPAALAAKAATTTIPIVFAAVADPVESGLVESLARPGGNLTGISAGAGPGFIGKHLELLKEAVPRLSAVGVFINSAFSLHATWRPEAEAAARNLNLTLTYVEVRTPEDINGAFATLTRKRLPAALVLGQPLLFTARARLAKLALDHRVATVIAWREAAEAGALLAYGEWNVDHVRRVPKYIDRILKGTKPADLPVEQPTTFKLTVNLKTAKALGLTIPPSLLLRADQVIE
jgi:putative ABC transport system substrate-binding protein